MHGHGAPAPQESRGIGFPGQTPCNYKVRPLRKSTAGSGKDFGNGTQGCICLELGIKRDYGYAEACDRVFAWNDVKRGR